MHVHPTISAKPSTIRGLKPEAQTAILEARDKFSRSSKSADPVFNRADILKASGGIQASFEPWLQGTSTDNPKLDPKFAAKIKSGLGEQSLGSIQDDRVQFIGRYFLEGMESVGGDDFVNNVAQIRLGDKWTPTEKYGGFELKADGVRQELSFDMSTGVTRLESSYEEHIFDTSTFREILTLDRNGNMRREYPPVGL